MASGDYELGPDVRTLSQLIAKAEGLRGSEFASRGQISRFDSTTSIYTVIPFVVSDVASVGPTWSCATATKYTFRTFST